jgi:hypothetical protein
MLSQPQRSEDPPIGELLRSIVDQSQVFVRAEVALLKVEAKQTLTEAVIALAVLMAGCVLVAGALSLAAASLVLARSGSAVAALLTAAGVNVVVTVVAAYAVVALFRRKKSQAAAPLKSGTPQLTNAPQHGNTAS